MSYVYAGRLARLASPGRPSGGNIGRGEALRRQVRPNGGELVTAMGRRFAETPRIQRPQLYNGRLTSISVAVPSRLSGMQDFRVVADPGLGFSLKPPKFIRKAAATVAKAATQTFKEVKHLATIKNIAIAGGALIAAPFVLPVLAAGAAAAGGALATGAGAVGSGLLTAGKFAGKEVMGLERAVVGLFKGKAVPEGPPLPPGTDPYGNPVASAGDTGSSSAPTAYSPTAPAMPMAPAMATDGGSSSGGYGSSGGGGGGLSTPTAGDDAGAQASPAQAGMFGGTSPLLLGALAIGGLYMVTRATRGGRTRRRSSRKRGR